MNHENSSNNKVHHSLEVEMKFFIEDSDRKQANTLRSLNQYKEITQYFFSLELTQDLHSQLILGHEKNPYVKSFDFSKAKARVRQIKDSSGDKSFLVGFKGSKDPELLSLGVTAKPELEIEISAERYETFKIQADQGSVSKTRVFYPFKANKDSLTLELDLINQLNGQTIEPRFIVGEIELDENRCKQQIAEIRETALTIAINDNTKMLLSEIKTGSKDSRSVLVSNRKLLAIYGEGGIPQELKEFF